MAKTLTNEQRRQILALVEAQSWGDIDYAMRAVDETLHRTIEATADDFLLWEQEADAAGFVDEFTVEAGNDSLAKPTG